MNSSDSTQVQLPNPAPPRGETLPLPPTFLEGTSRFQAGDHNLEEYDPQVLPSRVPIQGQNYERGPPRIVPTTTRIFLILSHS